MTKMIALYIDDQKEESEVFARWIRDAWEISYPKVELEVITVEGESEYFKILDNHKEISITIVDIMFNSAGVRISRGYDIIGRTRKMNPDMSIIGLTRETTTEVRIKALQNGADELVSKMDLFNSILKINDLSDVLNKVVSSHQNFNVMLENIDVILINENDYKLVEIIERVGRKYIIEYCKHFLNKEIKKIVPRFIKSGLSGATVLIAKCTIEEKGFISEKSLLLKMSKDKHRLAAENIKDISNFPERLFVHYINVGNKVCEYGSYYCIASYFEDEAITLIEWLLKNGRDRKSIDDIIDKLFNRGENSLQKVYSNIVAIDDKSMIDLVWEELGLSRKARILDSMEELNDLIVKYDINKCYNESLIRNFLSSKIINNIQPYEYPMGGKKCYSHGDFHGRNIIVKSIKNEYYPLLIDPGSVDIYHYTYDLARLIVDLMVSGYDYGTRSHEWDYIEEWISLFERIIKSENVENVDISNSNEAIYYFCCKAYQILPGILKQDEYQKWEFQMSLVVELLRSAYRKYELSSPKRVFSLIMACKVIIMLSSSIQKAK